MKLKKMMEKAMTRECSVLRGSWGVVVDLRGSIYIYVLLKRVLSVRGHS